MCLLVTKSLLEGTLRNCLSIYSITLAFLKATVKVACSLNAWNSKKTIINRAQQSSIITTTLRLLELDSLENLLIDCDKLILIVIISA